MALSMEERRILAEIEQHLTRSEPALAARLASFGRSGDGLLATSRAWVLAPLAALVLIAIVSVVMYAFVAVRGVPQRGARPAAPSHHPSMTAGPAHPPLRSSGPAGRSPAAPLP
jgi:DUF3040 family protein